jgi:hypothetical protein
MELQRRRSTAMGFFPSTKTLDTHQTSKPSNRRGTRQRSSQQAQQVLRHALIEEIKIKETATTAMVKQFQAVAPVEGVKEAAWIARRKSRLLLSQKAAT